VSAYPRPPRRYTELRSTKCKSTAFYRDVVQLPPAQDMGPDAFAVGSGTFVIDGHSETSGPAAEPQRVLINFFVDAIAAEEARLEGEGVPFIRKQGKEFWGGTISTFVDPDGNYGQLVQFRPEDAPSQ